MAARKTTLIKWILNISFISILVMGILLATISGIFIQVRTDEDYKEIASSTSVHIANMLDTLSDGDYNYDETEKILRKGDVVITGEAFEKSKAFNSNIHHTIFWGNTRVISDITDDKGQSVVGTVLDSKEIINAVEKEGIYNATKVPIYGSDYTVCYYPLRNNGDIVGYVFTGVDRREATGHIVQDVIYTILISAVIAIIIMSYSNYSVRREGKSFNDNLTTVASTIADKRVIVENRGQETNENMSQINVAIAQMSKAVTLQATNSEKIMVTMDNFGKSLESIMSQVGNTSGIAKDSTQLINELSNELATLEGASKENSAQINDISEQIEDDSAAVADIEQIVKIINDIALQIMILSFNASVEAARAGEAGKGFAVVAGSVKELSDKTQTSVNQISSIIETINDKMAQTSKSSQELMAKNENLISAIAATKNRMGSVVEAFDKIMDNISVAQKESGYILDAKNQVMERVSALAAASEENASMSAEIAATADNVIERTGELMREIDSLQAITDIVGNTKKDFM